MTSLVDVEDCSGGGVQKPGLGHKRIGRRSCGGGLVMATMGVIMLN